MTTGHLFVRGKKMNKKQLTCFWIAIIVIVLMGLFPPWTMIGKQGPRYAFILTPLFEAANFDETGRPLKWTQFDACYLFFGWFLVAVVSAGFIYCVKDRQKEGISRWEKFLIAFLIMAIAVSVTLIVYCLFTDSKS